MRSLPFFLGTGGAQSPGSFAALDAYFEAGGHDLDTARVYGRSEATLGAWIASRGVANEIRVLTKGGHPDLATWVPRLSRADILDDLARSLDTLGIDTVETYLLHRDDPATPVDEIADTLTAVVADGRARGIGVSNWTAARVEALAAALTARGGPDLTWVSNHYGLARANPSFPYPGCETASRDLWPLARRLGFGILSWSAQSSGYFAGADVPYFDGAESRRRREVLERTAADHGVPPLAVLVRWLVTADPVLVPVFGSGSAAHVRELVGWSADAALDPAVATLTGALGQTLPDPGSFSEDGAPDGRTGGGRA